MDNDTVNAFIASDFKQLYPNMLKFCIMVKQGLQAFYTVKQLETKGSKLLPIENAAQLRTMWSKVVEKTKTMWHLGDISYYFISFFSLYVLGFPVFLWRMHKETRKLQLQEIIPISEGDSRPILNMFSPIVHIQQTGKGTQSHYQALSRSFALQPEHFTDFIDITNYNIIY